MIVVFLKGSVPTATEPPNLPITGLRCCYCRLCSPSGAQTEPDKKVECRRGPVSAGAVASGPGLWVQLGGVRPYSWPGRERREVLTARALQVEAADVRRGGFTLPRAVAGTSVPVLRGVFIVQQMYAVS